MADWGRRRQGEGDEVNNLSSIFKIIHAAKRLCVGMQRQLLEDYQGINLLD